MNKENTIRKRLNNINTYHFFEGDITIAGEDELGEEFTVTVDAYELLGWINTDQIRDELATWLLKSKEGNKNQKPSQTVIMNRTFEKEKE